jgi:hypothetical protein
MCDWLITAFHLLVALQLNTKDYRIIRFPLGTLHNPHWMIPGNEDGSPAMASETELESLKVSVLLFPALAQLPEENLEGLGLPENWGACDAEE